MSVFKLTKTLLVDPFIVEVDKEHEDGTKKLVGKMELKHPSDWSEAYLDEYVALNGEYRKYASLYLSGKGGKNIDGQLTSAIRAFGTVIRKAAIINDPLGPAVWVSLSLSEQQQIIKAFIEWAEEVAKNAKKEQ